MPDVPTVLDFAKTPADREVLELFLARQKYSRPFAAPPGVPAPIIAALRAGFAKLASDPEFLREAALANSPIVLAPGEEIVAGLRSRKPCHASLYCGLAGLALLYSTGGTGARRLRI